MALSAKLAMRQGQSMVLTPQLLQAIKLLQMPNAELSAFIEDELERNPLLERADDAAAESRIEGYEAPARPKATRVPGDWASENSRSRPGRAGAMNSAPKSTTRSTPTGRRRRPSGRPRRRDRVFPRPHGRGSTAAATANPPPIIEAYVAAPESLGEHLTRQAMIIIADPVERMIAVALIDAIDENGYLTGAARRDRRRGSARRSPRSRRRWSGCRRWSRPACSRAISPSASSCN